MASLPSAWFMIGRPLNHLDVRFAMYWSSIAFSFASFSVSPWTASILFTSADHKAGQRDGSRYGIPTSSRRRAASPRRPSWRPVMSL